MQDLLENTAVSGSNEGIIRIWEISSEKFVRWTFTSKASEPAPAGGSTAASLGRWMRWNWPRWIKAKSIRSEMICRNWCWAVMTMGSLLFGRWEVQMKRWWIEIVQIKNVSDSFSSGFTVISVTRSSRHSLVPWHGQVATIKPTNMQNNSSTFAVTTWWPARKTKQYVCINLPAFYTLPLFFSTGNDKTI